jgi:hypothetical protein
VKDHEPWYVSIDWAGAVVMVLALGVSLSMVVGIIGAVVRQTPVSEARAQLFTTLFGAAIGAIASYLGMARARQHRLQAAEEYEETHQPVTEEKK